MIDRDELAAWLRLLETPRVGREAARRLLAAFGSPQTVFGAGRTALREVVGDSLAAALAQPPDGFAALLQSTLDWLGAAEDDAPRGVLTLGDAAYPPRLLASADPPLLLYTIGRVDVLAASCDRRGRQPQSDGTRTDNARAFAEHLSQAGLTIVSGLALGIDGAAHDGRAGRSPARRSPWSAPASTASIRRATAPWRTASREHGLIVSEYRARHATAGAELSDPQPHHRGSGARNAGGRGSAAVRLADHRAACRRSRPGSVRDSRLDPLAAVARLPCADQARREAC